MSHHDKFWEKFSQKIRQHQPEGYSDSDWQAMEQLLNENAHPSRGLNWKLAPLLLAAVLLGYFAGARFGFPSAPDKISAFPIPIAGIAQGQASPIMKGNTIARVDRKHKAFSSDSINIDEQATHFSLPSEKPDAFHSNDQQGLSVPPEGPVVNEPDDAQFPERPSWQNIQNRKQEVATPAIAQLPEKNIRNIPFSRNPEIQTAAFLPLSPKALSIDKEEENALPSIISVSSSKVHRSFYSGMLLGGNLAINSPGGGGYSFYPFGGFFAGIEVGPRWALQAEAHVKYTGNFSVEYERTSMVETNNGYLFDQVSRGALEKSFLSVEVPLEGRYRLGPDWFMMAGFRPAFIFEDGHALFGGNKQDEALTPSSGLGQERAEAASIGRLRKFDIGVSAALEWAFHRKWSVNARFAYGFLDLSPEKVFETPEKHFNSGLQFSIRRKF